MTLTCYIHVPSTMTPHVRFINGASQDEMFDDIERTLSAWPDFLRVEVYDETNKSVMAYDRTDRGLGQTS